ncbi:hypothetical protein EDB80DRAFT_900504 [Ilyonectria destructans]|nr:hypothetical protein EDB80DRAFT_900504 [Ilyonectria destructans]
MVVVTVPIRLAAATNDALNIMDVVPEEADGKYCRLIQPWSRIWAKNFPGIGHMEHVEIDWMPRWDADKRPEKSVFEEWAELFYDGMDHFNRCARVKPQETRQMIEAAGFTDVREEVIKVNVCPWSENKAEHELARWFNLRLTQSLEALSLMPPIEKKEMTIDEVRQLCAKVKKEMCTLSYHTYCKIYVWTARKPEDQ